MITLSALTQSRLALLVFDAATNSALARLPVYAELAVQVDEPPYLIHEAVNFSEAETPLRQFCEDHPSILGSINRVISSRVAESAYAAIPNKHDLYVNILTHLKPQWSDADTDEHLQRILEKAVTQTLARLGIKQTPQRSMRRQRTFPLGTLATDHTGYLSFDLTHVVRAARMSADAPTLLSTDVSLLAYPFAKDELVIDVVEQSRFTPTVVFAKVTVELPNHERTMEGVALPSMQSPDLEDWYLSPGSFALNPEFFVGADGCENLYPANFATHQFAFFQVIRGRSVLAPRQLREGLPPSLIKPEVRAGWTLEYQVSWQPLGHTLGQLLYSLPLAPGETTKMAVIDWARKSVDSRSEDLTVKEQLAHNTHRDRNISETVDAAMQEWQRGGSFMGGVAGSYGGSGFGISGALGGGYSTSSGDRSIHASTVQQISDAFAQASSAVRELRSTIVVQSDQQEHAEAATRVIANHNHSHMLTMLYYEVLRHYKVSTEFMRVRPSLLIEYERLDFNELHTIIRHRRVLESVLLEPRYLGCFDAAQRLSCLTTEMERKVAQLAKEPDPNDLNELGDIKLVIKTRRQTGAFAYVYVVTRNLEHVKCLPVSPQWKPKVAGTYAPFHISLPDTIDDGVSDPGDGTPNYRQEGQESVFVVKPVRTVLWDDVTGLLVRVGDEATVPTWEIDSLRAVAVAGNWMMVDYQQLSTIAQNAQKLFDVQPYKTLPKDPMDLVTEGDRCCITTLQSHLIDNAMHYEKAVWLLEDPNERATRFKGTLVDGVALLDLVDNRPLDVLADYVVFPARGFHERNDELLSLNPAKLERLMTLPTRGVFGDAKLGHCNASEEIDDTRFWNWQTSPITEEAPGIGDVDINTSRNAAANLTATELPSSIVNIVNPQSLPDPTGMAAALKVLGTPEIFRDMSVSKEVGDLLNKLADKSVDINEASNRAKAIQQQQRQEASAPATAGTPTGKPSAPTPTAVSPAEAQQQIKVVENQASKGTITQEEKQQYVKKALDSMPGGPKKSEVIPWQIILTSEWLGEGIQQPMKATYSGHVRFGQLLDDDKQLIEWSSSEDVIWDAPHEKIPLTATFTVSNMQPPTGEFTIEVPGLTVDGLAIKAQTFKVPLRTGSLELPETLNHTVNGIKADPKSPALHFHGTGALKTKEIKLSFEVSSTGELLGEIAREFEKGASLEILKLALKSTLKSAVKIAIGGKAGIEGTFEIIYLKGYEVKQLLK